MNNVKAKRKLRGYWIKGDIKSWIDQKYRMKHYRKHAKEDRSFFIDMAVWNEKFMHEDVHRVLVRITLPMNHIYQR